VALKEAVHDLLQKGVIVKCSCSKTEFINRLFLVVKPNGSFRPILDSHAFNQFVEKRKFKMETIRQALLLVYKGCHMITVDLKDAYQGIPIFWKHHKFFRFRLGHVHYQFIRLSFGYTLAPWLFTKMLKV